MDFSVDEGGDGEVRAHALADDKGQGHVDFRISVHADGGVDVNGDALAVCDPADGCRISLAWSPATGALVVQVEDKGGSLRSALYALAEMPSEVEIAAAEIRALSVTRQ